MHRCSEAAGWPLRHRIVRHRCIHSSRPRAGARGVGGWGPGLPQFNASQFNAYGLMASLGAIVLLTASTRPVDFGVTAPADPPATEVAVDTGATSRRPTVFELEAV